MNLDDIGTLLKQARRAARLSQADLASRLGMSRATVSAIESGRCQEIGFGKLTALLGLVGLELSAARAAPARRLMSCVMICALDNPDEEANAPCIRQRRAHRQARPQRY